MMNRCGSALLASAAMLATVTGCHPAQDPPPPASWEGRVVAVLDGDTIDVDRAGQRVRVRLLSIDAPEVAHDGASAACGGEAARGWLNQRLSNRQVTVATDTAADQTDRYGRTLAYVYLGQLDIGIHEVSEGYAGAWSPAGSPTPSRQAAYQQAEQHARADRRGSWHVCPTLGRR